MNAPYYNGDPGDEDPEGDGFALKQEEDRCTHCGAPPNEPCSPFCECRYCRPAAGEDVA